MGDFNIVNLASLTDAFKYLLDKLEKFGCFLVNPKGTEQDAINSLIKSIEIADIEPIKKAAMISEARSIIRKYKNKNKIYEIALKELSENPDAVTVENIENVDEEWLSRFSESAQHVSNEEVQVIWGKILAKEIQQPGSIPKALLHVLSITDTYQAHIFSILCGHTICYANRTYIYCDYYKDRDYWDNLGLNFENLLSLQEIGLITFEQTKFFMKFPIAYDSMLILIGHKYFELRKNNKIDQFPFDDFAFTKSGCSLCSALSLPSNNSQIDHIASSLNREGFIVIPR